MDKSIGLKSINFIRRFKRGNIYLIKDYANLGKKHRDMGCEYHYGILWIRFIILNSCL